MSIEYGIFGFCLLCLGATITAIYFIHQWRKSEQRAREEYWRFQRYMISMGIEKEALQEVLRNMKSISQLRDANERLKKCVNE